MSWKEGREIKGLFALEVIFLWTTDGVKLGLIIRRNLVGHFENVRQVSPSGKVIFFH